MSLRLTTALIAAICLAAPAAAQTTAKPTATTPAKPAPAGEDNETSAAQIKACNAKWKLEKARAGAKTDAKAYHIFMGNCL